MDQYYCKLLNYKIFRVCDKSKVARKPTEEEKRLLCKPKLTTRFKSGNSVNSNTSLTSSSIKSINSKGEKTVIDKKFRVKEKALKITVKKSENSDCNDNFIKNNTYVNHENIDCIKSDCSALNLYSCKNTDSDHHNIHDSHSSKSINETIHERFFEEEIKTQDLLNNDL